MANKKTPAKTGGESLPNLSMAELGFSGLSTLSGQPFKNCRQQLNWPLAAKTFSEMSVDSTIFPAISNVESMISRVPWLVKSPDGFEDETEYYRLKIEQMVGDMEHTFTDFIRKVSSFSTMGFSIAEKVLRKRLHKNGSKFNDGLIGLRKLPIRPQDTVDGWKWKNSGRDLSHVVQRIVVPQNKTESGFYTSQVGNKQTKDIPRSRFLLFNTPTTKDDPTGQSPLVAVWEDWRYLRALKETEALGISQDMRGLKVLYIPPKYMVPDASPEDQEIYEYYKRVAQGLHKGDQTSIILPQVLDGQGEQFFKLDLLSVTGKQAYDIDKVISRYQVSILTCLMANFLSLGNTGGGSYALSDNLMAVSEMAIESRLNEIKEVLNHDLIPTIFRINGWSTEVMPYFEYGNVSKPDLEVFCKGVQQVKAVGMMQVTAKNVNFIAKQLSLPDRVPENATPEELDKLLTPMTSRSGDSAEKGSGNGTSDKVSSDDKSASNKDNK